MDSRHGSFKLLTIGAWIVGSAMAIAGAGCIPGSVSGTASPDGGPTINVQQPSLACSQTPSGCLCASRAAQPDDVTACTAATVATHTGEQGACCGSMDLCTCDAFACKSDSALGFCQCGATGDLPAALTGAAMAACPSAAGQKCCMATDTRVCVCSGADCDSGSTMVNNCAVDMVSTCPAGQQGSTSCK